MHPYRFLAAILCLAAALLVSIGAFAQSSTWPPAPVVKLAVNPVTNKVYLANTASNTVTAYDASTGTSSLISVGGGPAFIAVNPVTNRIYVDNERDASLSVIDGATDQLITTYSIGSSGPIAIDPVNNMVYVVRLTGTGSDEVTYFNGATNNWYTAATNSFQPIAVAVNPATQTIYVAHYGTGDVRVISGVYNTAPGGDFPASISIGMGPHPTAIAVNPVTNKVYVIGENPSGPIAVINGANNTAAFPAVASGHALAPKSLAVNPATNKIYAAFANEVTVIDGASNALSYIPITGASSGAVSLAIDYAANRVYAATELGSLIEIDGDTNTVVSTSSIPSGTSGIGVMPTTGSVFTFDTALATRARSSGTTTHANPLVTSITPLPGNSSGTSGSITVNVTSTFSSGLPAQAVHYRFDSTNGPWAAVSGSGPFAVPLTGLSTGSHTLYAYAVDGQHAPLATSPGSMPLIGRIASYAFTIQGTNATVSLASSANPATVGQSVTFTASVTGASGTPTGTVTFKDGTTTLCDAAPISGGIATCAASALTPGSHSITAQYSGNATYAAATSAAITQTINKLSATVALASSANPSVPGQSVTFTATLSGSLGAPTGTVTFKDGATTLCSAVAISTNKVACTTSALTSGTHSITAQYSGDGTYNTATSSVLTQTVSGTAATVSLASSANPSTTGAAVTFTATVTGTASTPTGTVTFTDGSATLCGAVALSGGSASCSTSSLAVGSHSIVAQYSGNTTYGAASSNALTQTVNTTAKADATVALSSSANPAAAQQPITFTATVSGSVGTPDGTVTFLDGGAFVAGCAGVPLSGGTAACTSNSLSAGTHSIVAQYSGNGSYNPGASPTLSQQVNAAPGDLVTRYRLYSPQTLEHLYTSDTTEYAYLSNQIDPNCCGWTAEGPVYRIFNGPGEYGGVEAAPEYRLYNPYSHQHHWTTDANEYAQLGTLGWQQEGIDGYILPAQASGTMPLYRLYLNAQGGFHLWTTDANEVATLTTSGGWVYEGVAGYVVPLP